MQLAFIFIILQVLFQHMNCQICAVRFFIMRIYMKSRHTQRLHTMKGCRGSRRTRGGSSSCGAPGCPIAPYSWKQMQHRGGKTKKAHLMKSSRRRGRVGGGFYKPAPPMPGPFIGSPWKADIYDWPGVNGISGDKNYYQQNMYFKDPQTMMKVRGGGRQRRAKKMHKTRKLRGGGLVPQDLVNIKNSIVFNATSAYNSLTGVNPPTNPLPYKDQLSTPRR